VDIKTSEPSRKRILVISPWKSRWSLEDGAGVSDDYHFIEKLTRSGFELHFLIPTGGRSATLPFENFHTYTYPNFFDATMRLPVALKRLLWPLLFNVIVIPRALLLGRRLAPDLVLGHSHHGAFPAYVCREMLRIPSALKLFGVMDLVHTEWSQWKYYWKNLEQICALKFPQDAWIILDDGTRGRDAAIRHGVPAERIHFLQNGMETEWIDNRIDRDEARGKLGIPQDARVVLFLARLVRSKRPWALIQAIPHVVARGGGLFLFVGDGPESTPCRTLAGKLGVEADIQFLGARPHNEVPEIMAASDVFVSTSNLTNMAMPTCEAMMCGVPVVAFDTGTTRDVVKDGETGRVVADGNIEALADAIVSLLDDPAMRSTMGEKARALARRTFVGWDERTDMEIEIIRDAMAS
jgi:glycosyltransferase involved in cell wall biosynthesis